jgi:hypothetical protein
MDTKLDRPHFARQDIALPGDQPFNLSTLVIAPATLEAPARRIAAYRFNGHSEMGITWLDGWDRGDKREHHLCKLPLMGNEDPRLLRVGGDISMMTIFNGAMRIEVRSLQMNHGDPQLSEPARINHIRNFPGYSKGWEKNWIPFDYDGQLHFVYSVGPTHRIVRMNNFDEQNADVELIASTQWKCPWPTQWMGHGLRGGGPALRIPGRDSYLAAGHTFVGGTGYFTFFYTFSAKPPFAVESFSPSPVFTPADTTGENKRGAWPDRRCIFINGMELEQTPDGFDVLLTGGDNDAKAVVFGFHLADVLAWLVGVAELKPVYEFDGTIRPNVADVTEHVRGELSRQQSSNVRRVVASNANFGDPALGQSKMLCIDFMSRLPGMPDGHYGRFLAFAREGEAIEFVSMMTTRCMKQGRSHSRRAVQKCIATIAMARESK